MRWAAPSTRLTGAIGLRAAWLALALLALALFPHKAVDLESQLDALRHAYRVRAPLALAGDGVRLASHHPTPDVGRLRVADPRAPSDATLYNSGLCTAPLGAISLPAELDVRIRGRNPSPVAVYLASPGREDHQILLDPGGEPPRLVLGGSQPAAQQDAISPPFDFVDAEDGPDTAGSTLYTDLSVSLTGQGITVSDGSRTHAIDTPVAGSVQSLCVAPVVSRTLALVDRVALFTAGSDSERTRTAVGTYRARPLLHPWTLESLLGERPWAYLAVSFALLAALSLLLRQGAVRIVRAARPETAESPAAPNLPTALLTLPGQILVLAVVRMAFGLALLPLYAVVVVAIAHELVAIPQATDTPPDRPSAPPRGPRRRRTGWVVALAFLTCCVHAAFYAANHLAGFSAAWLLLAAALPALMVWRWDLDRQLPLLATLLILAQCALFVPLRFAHPALTPVTFYALVSIPWVIALVRCSVPLPGSPPLYRRLFQVAAVIVSLLLVEVAIRGDHHLGEATSSASLVRSWYNGHIRQIMESSPALGGEDQASTAAVEVAGRSIRVAKPDGTLRIVCLGSSSTYGVGAASLDQTYPAQLESLLATWTGREVEVINGGVPGAMLSFLAFYLDRVLLPLEPDLIVVYFGANGDSVTVEREVDRLGRWLSQGSRSPRPTEVWAATQLRWPRPWLVSGLAATTRSRCAVWLVNAAQLLRRAGGPGVAGVPTSESSSSAIERARQRADSTWHVTDACRARGTALMLLPEITRDESDDACVAHPEECSHPYYAVFEHVARTSDSDEVQYANLLPAFPQALRDEQMLDEVHLESHGYRHLAEVVASLLLERGLVRSVPPDPAEAGP